MNKPITPEPPKRYRAQVFIKGAVIENVYGKLAGVERGAIQKLTTLEPGHGLFPDRIEISEHIKPISRNQSQWKLVKTIRYEDIPETQHEWRRRKAARAANAGKTL